MGDAEVQLVVAEGGAYQGIRIVNLKGKRVLARTTRVSDGCECFIKVLNGSEAEQSKLTMEWLFLQKIGVREGILQGLEVIKTSLGLGLVTKYVPGVSILKCELFSDATRVSREGLLKFCRVAVQACEALGWVHKADIVHRDISESNIIYDPDTGQVTIVGFGLSSLEHLIPEAVVGTWKYISPESTGRTGLPRDCRADLYSLGAVLYELAAGRPLFLGNDALALIHKHLTTAPVPLHEAREGIPLMLSKIVMKLVEKHPQHRYQSAWGACYDFSLCLTQIESSESMDLEPFDLGQNDIPNTIRRPSILYGRNAVMGSLRKLLSEVNSNTLRLVMLSGPSGSGKTSVAKALHNEVQLSVRKGRDLIWLGSKLDQFVRVPYACFIPIFEQFVDRCLTLGTEFPYFLQRLLKKMNGYGELLLKSFPMLRLILGDQPALPEMHPSEEKKKFLQVCQDFFSASFCYLLSRFDEPHPTVLFFDDIQWADSASLELLEVLCELKNLPFFALCVHRSVPSDHILINTTNKIRANIGSAMSELAVDNLAQEDISTMLTDTFRGHCGSSMVAEFSAYIQNSTLGNPFFVIQLLDALHQKKAIQFERTLEGGEWVWYPGLLSTNDVVGLLVSKIKILSVRSQEIIRVAALVGSTFDLDTMHAMTQIPTEDLRNDLHNLIDLGLIVAVSDQETISRATTILMSKTDPALSRVYRFLHDGIQQAASKLFTTEEEKAKAHYSLGVKMWEGKSHQKDLVKLFEVANHLLEGIQFVKQDEKLEACELFLKAGKHARAAMSGVYAQKYLSAIPEIFSPTPENWSTHEQLFRESYFELHEAAIQMGHFAQAQAYLQTVLDHSSSLVHRAEVLDKFALAAAGNDDNMLAAKLCFEILAMFGITFPSENLPAALDAQYEIFRRNVAESKIENLRMLIDFPPADTPEKECIARAFRTSLPCLYMINPPLQRVVAATCVNWCFHNGGVPHVCHACVIFSMALLWFFNDYEGADALAGACIEPNEKWQQQRACVSAGIFIFNWTRSHLAADMALERGYKMAVFAGDYVISSYACWGRATQIYSRPTLTADMTMYEELLEGNQKYGAGLGRTKGLIIAMMLGNSCLQGKSTHPFSLSTDGLVTDIESWVEEHLAEKRQLSLAIFYIYQALVLFIMFDAKGAFASLEKMRCFVPFIPSTILNAPLVFVDALCRLQFIAPSSKGTCEERPLQAAPCGEEEARAHMTVVDNCLVTLLKWAKNGPSTYHQMMLIVYAEKRRALSASSFEKLDPKIFRDEKLKKKERNELYRIAITSAKDAGNKMHLALAHELAMRYWVAEDGVDYAKFHWKAAMKAYSLWGAKGKLDLLQREFNYSNLARFREPQLSPSSSARSLFVHEKQAIFLASRLISSEIVLDKLLVNLMGVIAEHVGATFGLLLSYEEDKWKVECSYGASTLRTGLPTTILNFVYKKHEVVVLSDAATHETYHRDPYIAQYKPKSVLCVPIVLHGHFINAVYLENNGFEGTFTTGLSEVAELLASQAATAIQNGRLYRRLNDYNLSLEEQVRERTSQLSTAREHADQANKAKSTFLASMSHEIRTPMNGIMASMELLKMTRLTDEQTELADVVITCADALLVLINDILDLSKIEADKLELECVWFDLQRCLESVLDILAPKAFPKGLDIEFQTWGPPEEKLEVVVKGQKRIFCADVPRVIRGDYTRFRQILVNLCNNAVKFTRLGEVTIKVWWRPLEEHKDRFLGQPVELYFSVLDTGIGMPAARLPMLFKAFSQVENSTTRKYGGTGLGLAICQPLVQLMGGSIWVESEEGKGSNFQFTITTSCQDLNAVQCVNTVSDAKTPTLRPGLRVLLVQDASACASIFKGSLEKLGCVSTRASLAEGLPLLQTQIFDVCIVDWAPKSIEEPNMVCGEEELHMVTRTKHGERFIDEFRAWEITQQLTGRLPIVLSSYDRQHRIGPLIDGFLIKPTKQRHVLKVLNSVTQSARSSCSFTDAVKVHLRPDTASVASKSELKLMMAEDNKINVRMATKMVESVGYSMTIVHNGRQAVDQVKAWYEGGTPCQVLLMDVQMPVMDGLEATAMIRSSSIPVSEQPYIIALTANAMASDRLMCLQAGMNDYLSKPLNRQDLARALRTAALAKGVIVSELNVPYNASP